MIPYSTDAPIYHLPFATGGLIALNILIFIATLGYESDTDVMIVDGNGQQVSDADLERLEELELSDPDAAAEQWESFDFVPVSSGDSLLLQYGNGVRPWQWVSSIFMHAGIGHLIGNMIFLWSFGLIVEGKVGWKAFLAIYFAIGVGQSGIEQIMMLGASGGASLGASAAIFGLLGVAMMWAPRNDFECFWTYGTFEIPVLAFAGFKFAMEALTVFLQGFAVTGALLHLMGAAAGLGVGAVYIKKNWVDCEGYDFFSVMAGTEGRREELEHLDREASALMNGAYHAKVGSSNAGSTTAKPAIAFPPAQPFQTQASKVVAARPSGDSPLGTAAQSPVVQPVRPVQPQPVIPEISSLDDLFGGFETGSSQGDAAEDFDTVESLHQAIETAAQRRQFDDIPELLQSIREFDEDYELPQDVLRGWIEYLLAEKRYPTAIPLMTQHIRRFEQKRLAMRVQLSKILIHQKQPERALKVLSEIDRSVLSAEAVASLQQLDAKAKSLVGK